MSDADKYIGSLGDNGVASRTICIPRYEANEVDKYNLTYVINTKYPTNNTENTIYPDKTYDGNNIYLTWNIKSNDIPYSGNIFIQIKAYDVSGTFIWNSYKDYLVIGDSLGSSQTYNGDISALESAIAQCENVVNNADTVLTDAETAKGTFNGLVTELEITKTEINTQKQQAIELINNMQNIVDVAGKKLDDCQTATVSANTAAQSVTEALSTIEVATINANEATNNASSAISNANIATSNANEATDRALAAAIACEGITDRTGLVLATEKGASNGVASLDADGKVPKTQLPEITSSNIVSVKEKGGAAGDGITDDTQAFKTAINKVITDGGVLYIDEGTYLIKEKLIITKSITITGAGTPLSIVKYRPTVTTEGHKFNSTNYEGSNACFIIQGDNSVLNNFTIDGGTSESVGTGNGVIMHYVKRFQNHAGYIYKNKVMVTLDPKVINGLDFDVTYDAKISVQGTSSVSNAETKIGDVEMQAGTYILSGCPSGGSQSTYCLKIVVNGTSYYDTGSGVSFTITENEEAELYFCYTTSISYNLTLEPMVRASTSNDTFVTGWYLGFEAAQRVSINQMNFTYMKNGVDITGGWNREIKMCNFVGCSNAGIQYISREEDRLGQYCSSGDVITACQFVANTYGVKTKNTYQTRFTNCIYEYNDHAISTENDKDIVFEQCWNEANTGNILVKGNAKFIGGFNVSYSEVTHTLIAANDLCTFQSSTEQVMSREGIIIFHQVGGVITSGVEIGAEIQNLIPNPYWKVISGATSYADSYNGWEVYPNTNVVYIDSSNKYNENNSVTVSLTGRTTEQYFQIMTLNEINIDRTHTFTFSVKCKTPDRSAIDGNGVMVFITYKDASGNTVSSDNQTYTMIADNVWETFEYSITSVPAGVSSVKIGLGLEKNGTVSFSVPSLIDNSNYGSSDVYVKQDKTNTNNVNLYSADGTHIRTLDTNYINPNNGYTECSTAAQTSEKVAALTGYKLATGSIVNVKFTCSNTAASPTLNINSTGAKAIYKKGVAVGNNAWIAGQVIELVYDGTQWNIIESGNYSETTHEHANYATKASPTFTGTPNVETSTNYTTAMLRNIVLTTTDPGNNASSSYPNGTIISVYE